MFITAPSARMVSEDIAIEHIVKMLYFKIPWNPQREGDLSDTNQSERPSQASFIAQRLACYPFNPVTETLMNTNRSSPPTRQRAHLEKNATTEPPDHNRNLSPPGSSWSVDKISSSKESRWEIEVHGLKRKQKLVAGSQDVAGLPPSLGCPWV